MPEATIDEHSDTSPGERYIRPYQAAVDSDREIFAEPEPCGVQG
jgi:hypothetical protein